MSIKKEHIIESFKQDVVSDAYLYAMDMPSGKIFISQLDGILQEHPWYSEIELDDLETAVYEIEQVLYDDDKLATPIYDRIVTGA